ncbi:protein Aster-B-like [Podargus strigoides]
MAFETFVPVSPSLCSLSASFDGVVPEEEEAVAESPVEKDLGTANIMEEKMEIMGPVDSPSLDCDDEDDIPAELNDSSESCDEGEVQAFYEDLKGHQLVNKVFKFSMDKLYDLLFTASQLQRDFMEQRRMSDIVFHPWKKEEDGNQTRVISYTIALTHPLAPETVTVTETQTMYQASQESKCCVIDAELVAHDIPYHECFSLINRYTLTRVARNESRLRVSTELLCRQRLLGLMKPFIEKNFLSIPEDHFRCLERGLTRLESTYPAEVHGESPKGKGSEQSPVRRRKRARAQLPVPHSEEVPSPVTTPTHEGAAHRPDQVAAPTRPQHVPEESPSGFHLHSVSKLLLVICFAVVLLVPLTMMQFYQLQMLEYSTQTCTAWQGLRLQERFPQSQTECAQLLESQQKYHDLELQNQREIIRSLVVLLEQMKDLLINLQNGVGSRDFGSEPEEERKRLHQQAAVQEARGPSAGSIRVSFPHPVRAGPRLTKSCLTNLIAFCEAPGQRGFGGRRQQALTKQFRSWRGGLQENGCRSVESRSHWQSPSILVGAEIQFAATLASLVQRAKPRM